MTRKNQTMAGTVNHGIRILLMGMMMALSGSSGSTQKSN